MSLFSGLRPILEQMQMQAGPVQQPADPGMMYTGGSPTFDETGGGSRFPGTIKLQPGFSGGKPPTGGLTPMEPQANPFAALAGQMNPAGFARPEAQQWMQQALGGPYMAGWGQPSRGPGNTGIVPPGGGPGQQGPGTGVPLTDKEKNKIKKLFGAGQGAALASNLGSLANVAFLGGNPIGAAIGMGLQFATQNQGWLNTGIKAKWARETLEKYGYKFAGGGKVVTFLTPEGKRIGGSKLAAELISLIQQYGLQPKLSK